jgi:hypothetical protein
MADEVLVRQARTRADRTGEPLEDALKAPGWSSCEETRSSPAKVPRRGPR